ncbi:DUF418 domain-containing protein [Flavobacterium sp. GT3R68]|uniref:DUF418 domain-containing protein n=1 Tax=Flavobacterium sp. GT3R68 TaxID=2594437 RepID=UPI000F8856EE|nr:DUF418 domain-containing protein [Flavobacterium sp. GT3R68]RTY89141.1 DUF418 domain-containing protein [Flavobacterium sp. GSN2]TRW90061.1 DUF418 domain-containing protein [Flavobacterium sp. GT3R68]
MQQRIIGFDLARAYAIFGMFIVNFNFSFGSIMTPNEPIGHFLNIFTGNSTAIFIICAGMGVSLMTSKNGYSKEDKALLKSKILKRSLFLFTLGLLLYNWWSGDILHFYGGYMHLAAFLLFVPKRYYLWIAVATIIIFHILLFLIPIETSWDFTTFKYRDFWTPIGFLRNTFFNGWNSMFPWLSYFLVGMWLGKLNWNDKFIRQNIFLVGLFIFFLFQLIRFLAGQQYFSPFWSDYIMAEYFPPYLPFIMLTMGFALMVISFCMYIGELFSESRFILALQKTGQMTLSHYIIHLTIGMVLLAKLTNKNYTGLLEDEKPTLPIYILGYSILFYVFTVLFSVAWSERFKNGPLETVIRKISN